MLALVRITDYKYVGSGDILLILNADWKIVSCRFTNFESSSSPMS